MRSRITVALVGLVTLMTLNVSVISQKLACTIPPSGMVAWYAAEVNANDISGNGNNGTFRVGGSYGAGHVGQGFRFTGTTNVVEAPDNAMLSFSNAFSIEMWVSPTVAGLPDGTTFFVSKGDVSLANTQSYGILFGPNREVAARIGNGTTFDQAISATQIPLNSFSHIAITYDGSTLRVYINGALDASNTTTIGMLFDSSQTLVVGGARTGGTFVGAMGIVDETSLYNRELSLTEIQSIFNAGTAGKCLAPTAASAPIAGKILSPTGRGIPHATVRLIDQTGTIKAVRTNHFGYYRFDDIAVGQTLILDFFSKQFQFETQILNFNGPVTEFDITAQK